MLCLSKSNKMKRTMHRKFFSLSVLCLIVLFAGSQTNNNQQPGKPNELDNKFTPTHFPLFNSSGNAGSSGSGGVSVASFKNVVKFNVALLPRKIAALTYQRFLSDEVSLEASLGPIYGKDPVFSAIGAEISSETSSSNSYYSLTRILSNSRSAGMGLFAAGSVKFHFSGFSYWSDEGTFLELGVRSFSQKLDVTALKNAEALDYVLYTGSTEVQLRQTQFILSYGYRFATTGKLKTSHEFYFGAGWRTGTYNSYSRQEITNNYPYYAQTNQNGLRENFSSPVFVFGYIFGIGF